MKGTLKYISILLLSALSGCAHIDFGNEGLTYYDPTPCLFVSTSKECVTTATVVIVPGAKRSLKFKSGYGSAELNASFTNGMLASVGQKTDTKVPETITSVAALGTAIAGFKALADTRKEEPPKQVTCVPTAVLYPIDASGLPDLRKPLSFPVKEEKK